MSSGDVAQSCFRSLQRKAILPNRNIVIANCSKLRSQIGRRCAVQQQHSCTPSVAPFHPFLNSVLLLPFRRSNLCGKWLVLKQLLEAWHENRADKNKVLIFSKSAKLLSFLELEISKSTQYIPPLVSLMKSSLIRAIIVSQLTEETVCVILMGKRREKIVCLGSRSS